MRIVSNQELSFGALVDKGVPKEEIMKVKCISSDAEYQRIYNSLMEARKRAVEKLQGKRR